MSSEAEAAPARRGRLALNVMHLGLGQVATTALTMGLSAVVGRTLGAADFGLLYLLSSISAFAYVFIDWGHGPYVTREVARHPERSGEMMGSVLAIRTVMAAIACLLVVALTWALGYELRIRAFAALMIVAQLPVYHGLTYTWAFRGRERMDCDALLGVVLKSGMLAVSVVVLAVGGRVIGLIGAYALAGTITWIVATAVYRRLALPPLRVSWTTARELLYGGAPMVAIALAVALQPYIDANMLYKLVPQEVMGWHGAAWMIAGTLVAPATILGAAMYPRLSLAANRPDEFARALRTAFRPLLLVAVLGAVGTYLFAHVAIGLVYGNDKFGPASDTLSAFAPALMLIYIDMLFGHAILAAGKAGQLAKAKVLAVVVTTGVELALIPWFQSRYGNGGIGIVLALACGELVMVVAAVLLIRAVIERAMVLDFGRGLLAGGATIVLLQALPAIHPLLGIPLAVAAFAGFAAAAGLLKRADIELITLLVRRRQPPEPEKTLG